MAKSNNKTVLQDKDEKPNHITHSTALLEILISQIKAAISDNDEAMAQLTGAYASIAECVACNSSKLKNGSDTTPLQDELTTMAIAFQEHDAFNQRISHIANILTEIGSHLSNTTLRNDLEAWEELSTRLAASYTTDQERHIHNIVSTQAGIKVPQCFESPPNNNEPELF